MYICAKMWMFTSFVFSCFANMHQFRLFLIMGNFQGFKCCLPKPLLIDPSCFYNFGDNPFFVFVALHNICVLRFAISIVIGQLILLRAQLVPFQSKVAFSINNEPPKKAKVLLWFVFKCYLILSIFQRWNQHACWLMLLKLVVVSQIENSGISERRFHNKKNSLYCNLNTLEGR